MPSAAHALSRRRYARSERPPGWRSAHTRLPRTNAATIVLKHHPVWDPPTMAAQRRSRVELRALVAQESTELDPDRLQQA